MKKKKTNKHTDRKRRLKMDFVSLAKNIDFDVLELCVCAFSFPSLMWTNDDYIMHLPPHIANHFNLWTYKESRFQILKVTLISVCVTFIFCYVCASLSLLNLCCSKSHTHTASAICCVPIWKSGKAKRGKRRNDYVSFTSIYVAPFDSWRTKR